jgi:hypothetical protein
MPEWGSGCSSLDLADFNSAKNHVEKPFFLKKLMS